MASIDYTVWLLQGLVAPSLALITSYIAIQQYRSNRIASRAALYDRRFQVFLGLKDFLAAAMAQADVDDNQLHGLLVKTNQSIFLFGKEIPAYIRENHKQGVRLRTIARQLHNRDLPVGVARTALAEESMHLSLWFERQQQVSERKFRKYLNLN